MEEKNKKLILSILIIILLIIAVVFIVMIATKNNQSTNNQATKEQPTEQTTTEDQQIVPEDEVIPLTEEKKEELAAIEVTTGTITSVDIDTVVIKTSEEELTLKVPQEGANFATQTVQEDGSFLIEEIGLFDIPTDKEVEVQYNSKSNEVMLITVK